MAMRDMIRNIMVAMAGFALVACNSNHEGDDYLSFDEPRSVNFVLAIDSPTSTRATWGDTEPTDEIGTNFENRILPSSLRVEIEIADIDHIRVGASITGVVQLDRLDQRVAAVETQQGRLPLGNRGLRIAQSDVAGQGRGRTQRTAWTSRPPWRSASWCRCAAFASIPTST